MSSDAMHKFRIVFIIIFIILGIVIGNQFKITEISKYDDIDEKFNFVAMFITWGAGLLVTVTLSFYVAVLEHLESISNDISRVVSDTKEIKKK